MFWFEYSFIENKHLLKDNLNSANCMDLRKYLLPEIVIGDNSSYLTGKYAKNYNAQKVLLVTDSGIINAGWTSDVERSLENNSIEYIMYSNITPNPKDYEVEEGAELYIKEKCDLIIAVGGGSVIDCAKGIGIVSTNKKGISYFEGVDKVQTPMPPLICIPTTAGSSADISQFAIILNTKTKTKMALVSKALVPDVALIDPVTTTTMPYELTASTGMDALVHAIEAYVSNASSSLTNLNALKAIELISQNLVLATKEPYNVTYRNNVMLGSLLAGMAFSNASLGLVHAMSHSLGGLTNIAHGDCNATLLIYCLEYNFDACPNKFKDIYLALGGTVNDFNSELELKEKLLDTIELLRAELQIDKDFKKYNLGVIDTKQLAINAFYDPCLATNPKPIEVKEIESIYKKVL